MMFFSRLRRDALRSDQNHEPPFVAAFGAVAFGGFVAVAIGAAMPGMLAAFVVGSLVYGSVIFATYLRAARTGYKMSKNRVTDKDIKYAGSARDLGMVVNSLRCIRSLTKDFGAAAKLPEKLQHRVEAFIEDMKPAASMVSAFRGDQQLDSIPVSRTVVGPDGKDVEHVLTSVPTGKSPLSPRHPA